MNEVLGKKTRKKYSSEFKDQALERASRDGVTQAARDLGIDSAMLYGWRSHQREAGDSFEKKKVEHAEFARLKRENTRLAEENAFLKKAAAYFAKERP